MTERCKHDFGWCSEKSINVFIYDDGRVGFDFHNGSQRGDKIIFVCNKRCGATRNIYTKGQVIKVGKIKGRGA